MCERAQRGGARGHNGEGARWGTMERRKGAQRVSARGCSGGREGAQWGCERARLGRKRVQRGGTRECSGGRERAQPGDVEGRRTGGDTARTG